MSLAENLAVLAKFLTGDSAGNLTGTNTPPLDDSSKKLATTDFLTQQFAGTGKQLLAQGGGYQKLPGGLILQWGLVSKPDSSSPIVINYPIAFPTGPLIALACVGGAAIPNGSAPSTQMTSKTQLSIYCTSGYSGAGIGWLVLGI